MPTARVGLQNSRAHREVTRKKTSPQLFCGLCAAQRKKQLLKHPLAQTPTAQNRDKLSVSDSTGDLPVQVRHSMPFAHQAMHSQLLPNKKAQN